MRRRLFVLLFLLALLMGLRVPASVAQGGVPLPGPGQTVTWSAAMSPISISGHLVIPAGGTVVVEPGVEILFGVDSTLEVRGTLAGAGTESLPIELTAATVYPPVLHVVGGTVELSESLINGNIKPDDGATLIFDRATFEGNGVFFADNYNVDKVPYLEITNSHFEGPGAHINIAHLTLVLRNTTFHNVVAQVLYGHVYLDGVDFDGGRLILNTDHQPDYLNHITVRNASGAGIQLGGGNQGNNYFLGPDNILQDNEYPVGVTDGGLLPGSVVPATGNANNAVLGPGDGVYRGPVTWADVGVPYRIPGYAVLEGKWRLLPGTSFQLGPGAGFESKSAVEARGLPGNPVTFEPLVPGQQWYRMAEVARLEHTIVDGGQYALVYDSSGDPNYIDSTILRNNGFQGQFGPEGGAIVGSSVVRSSQFLSNVIGLRDGNFPLYVPPDANGATNPNSFVGNTIAAEAADDATHNWWGSPSGPTSPQNPGGTGDPIAPFVPFAPFRTTAPDYSDSPPVVTLNDTSSMLEPGSPVMLLWSGQDDGTITKYRILFSPAGDHPSSYSVVADNLPASQHAYQWTVPEIGFQVTGQLASIRVEAVDDKGQIGWAALDVGIPANRVDGRLTMTPDPSGNAYQAGYEAFDVCWTLQDPNIWVNGIDAYLFLEAERTFVPLGGTTTYLNCLPLTLRMPLLHTEDARLVLKLAGSLNDEKWFFSEFFTIFADPRVGDAPPAVAMTSPQSGQSYFAGQAVPITWIASDDEALRGFEIQASYDGGRTWHVVAADLPGTARSYSWVSAPNSDLEEVRMRVIATDLRFQNTSDGAERVIAIGGLASHRLFLPVVHR